MKDVIIVKDGVIDIRTEYLYHVDYQNPIANVPTKSYDEYPLLGIYTDLSWEPMLMEVLLHI